jgi:serine/threonine protein phosphatase 1
MKILKRLFGKSTDQAPPTVFSAPILPNRPLYVIGDIHGRADLLAKMLDRLADIREPESDLVFVGDIVDRGEDSALTLSTIKDITENPENAAHCLMGNHEKMLLDFLDEPTVKGARWLQYGGLQTLMSFGLREVTERASDEVLMAARDVFAETLPQETQTWLRELPLRFASGNVSVVHAAADPDVPVDQQTARVLLWGHNKFVEQPRTDEQWVVHGHTITEEPYAFSGKINVDTGAFATGRLTCVRIGSNEVEFFAVQS